MAQKDRRDEEQAGQPPMTLAEAVSFVALLDAEEESNAQAASFTLHAAERSFHDHTCDARQRRLRR